MSSSNVITADLLEAKEVPDSQYSSTMLTEGIPAATLVRDGSSTASSCCCCCQASAKLARAETADTRTDRVDSCADEHNTSTLFISPAVNT